MFCLFLLVCCILIGSFISLFLCVKPITIRGCLWLSSMIPEIGFFITFVLSIIVLLKFQILKTLFPEFDFIAKTIVVVFLGFLCSMIAKKLSFFLVNIGCLD